MAVPPGRSSWSTRIKASERVFALLTELAGLVPAARGRDLKRPAIDVPVREAADASWTGVVAPGVIGISLACRQAAAETLSRLAGLAEELGGTDICLAPEYSLLVTGLSDAADSVLLEEAGRLGFITHSNDPRAALFLCAGARGCACGHFDIQEPADRLLAEVPVIFDGSVSIHLSGCSKGCAHPFAGVAHHHWCTGGLWDCRKWGRRQRATRLYRRGGPGRSAPAVRRLSQGREGCR